MSSKAHPRQPRAAIRTMREPDLAAAKRLCRRLFPEATSRWDFLGHCASRKKLHADGTWQRTEISEFMAMGGGTNPITGAPLILESGPTKTVTKGRWNAGAGRVYMMSDKNSWEEYAFDIQRRPEGRVLKLTSGKSCDLWAEKQ